MSDYRTSLARKLRSESTAAETMLWSHLRSRQVQDRKWRRQYSIGPYIVDFFCLDLRLIIEVDGDVHAFQEEHDATRQAYLESQNMRVVRFTNEDVLKNQDGVLQTIWELSGER